MYMYSIHHQDSQGYWEIAHDKSFFSNSAHNILYLFQHTRYRKGVKILRFMRFYGWQNFDERIFYGVHPRPLLSGLELAMHKKKTIWTLDRKEVIYTKSKSCSRSELESQLEAKTI